MKVFLVGTLAVVSSPLIVMVAVGVLNAKLVPLSKVPLITSSSPYEISFTLMVVSLESKMFPLNVAGTT